MYCHKLKVGVVNHEKYKNLMASSFNEWNKTELGYSGSGTGHLVWNGNKWECFIWFKTKNLIDYNKFRSMCIDYWLHEPWWNENKPFTILKRINFRGTSNNLNGIGDSYFNKCYGLLRYEYVACEIRLNWYSCLHFFRVNF